MISTESTQQASQFSSMYTFLDLIDESNPPPALSTASDLIKRVYLLFIQAVPFLTLLALLLATALFGLSTLISPFARADVRHWINANRPLIFALLLTTVSTLFALPGASIQAFVDGSAFGVSPLALFSVQLVALLLLLDIEHLWAWCFSRSARRTLSHRSRRDELFIASEATSLPVPNTIHRTATRLSWPNGKHRAVIVTSEKWNVSFTSAKDHLPTIRNERRIQFTRARDYLGPWIIPVALVISSDSLQAKNSLPTLEQVIKVAPDEEDKISIPTPDDDEHDDSEPDATNPFPGDDPIDLCSEVSFSEVAEDEGSFSAPLTEGAVCLRAPSIPNLVDHGLVPVIETPISGDDEDDGVLDEVLYAASVPLPGEDQDDNLDDVVYAASIPLPGDDQDDDDLDEVLYAASIPLPACEDEDLDELLYVASIPLPGGDEDEDLDEVCYAASIPLPGEDEDDELSYAASIPLPSDGQHPATAETVLPEGGGPVLEIAIPLPADEELELMATSTPLSDNADSVSQEVTPAIDVVAKKHAIQRSVESMHFNEVTLVEDVETVTPLVKDEQINSPTSTSGEIAPVEVAVQPEAPEVNALKPRPRQRMPLNQRFLNNLIANNKSSNDKRKLTGIPVSSPTPTALPEPAPVSQAPRKKVDWRQFSPAKLRSLAAIAEARARQSAAGSSRTPPKPRKQPCKKPVPGGVCRGPAESGPAPTEETPVEPPVYVPSRRNRKKKYAAEAAATLAVAGGSVS
ncbi:hypothetical protein BXZ70DRAFT_1020668 [Cristinia sonorae]|uniref:Uncharacterized protein n=1 Tax=Cristinia sonorae TaxID=1940300 RepID=A0A8K0URY8_9AGAR|nr:hypothetical protein BXZ70DRAFT_1020668 [Cristinia sonorae]